MSFARLIPVGGTLAFESSYDAVLVAGFKAAIPTTARAWDRDNKRWIIDPAYAQTCIDLARRHLGVEVLIPVGPKVATKTETRLIRLEYLGRCKPRPPGEPSAFGFVDGGWSVIFPEAELQRFFEAMPLAPTEHATFYSALAIKATAALDEVRSAYRRLARQWHPDVCHEPDAATQFKAITRAYDVLIDPKTRRKYDAGLAFEATLTGGQSTKYLGLTDYRAPLRCGWILVEGMSRIGRFVVSKILDWQDVTDETGRVMIVSWPVGADKFEVKWQ